MTGIDRYTDKERRKVRRELHKKRDLRPKRKFHDFEHWNDQDVYRDDEGR